MLGNLARWLRISSYDAEYHRDIPDNELIEEARKDRRILVTRDEELAYKARKLGLESVYLTSVNDVEELRQLVETYELELDTSKSRCPKCNAELIRIGKEEVAGKVPKGTLQSNEEFWECRNCGGIYWRGSHWTNITETINKAMKPS